MSEWRRREEIVMHSKEISVSDHLVIMQCRNGGEMSEWRRREEIVMKSLSLYRSNATAMVNDHQNINVAR